MRKDIKQLCVTNWNAVLEFNGVYAFGLISVSDPEAVGGSQIIGIDEIKLVARIKQKSKRSNEILEFFP